MTNTIPVAAPTSRGQQAQFYFENAGLPVSRRNVYAYRKLGFLDDGFPARVTETERIPHPLYCALLVIEFARLHNGSGEAKHLEAMRFFADTAVGRLEEFHDSLVFTYSATSKLNSLNRDFYSGLTQARWVQAFQMVHEHTGEERYLDLARKVAKSLTISSSLGGVCFEGLGFPIIEEYPNPIPTLVQNGWTSAIVELTRFAVKTGSKDILDFCRVSANGYLSIIGRYDVQDYLNSRYGLGNYTWLSLKIEPLPDSLQFVSGKVRIAGFGEWPIAREGKNRFTNWFRTGCVASDGRILSDRLKLNLVLSHARDTVDVELTLVSSAEARLTVGIPKGFYDPKISAMPIAGWKNLPTLEIMPGENTIRFTIPMDEIPLLGYPTNFKKKIGGLYYNAYHYLHIQNLYALNNFFPRPDYMYWGLKWLEYVTRWPDAEYFKGDDISLRAIPSNTDFGGMVLAPPGKWNVKQVEALSRSG